MVKMNIKDLKELLKDIPDDYDINLSGRISVPDGQDRVGTTYSVSRYPINERISEICSVSIDDDTRDITLNLSLVLDEQ